MGGAAGPTELTHSRSVLPSGFLVWGPPALPGPCKVQGSRADGKGLPSLACLQQVPLEAGLAEKFSHWRHV